MQQNGVKYKEPGNQDRAIYEEFLHNQKRLRENFAGSASNNMQSQYNYGKNSQQIPYVDAYKKYRDNSQEYRPMENSKNIYERKLTKEIPKTRDRFIGNAFS